MSVRAIAAGPPRVDVVGRLRPAAKARLAAEILVTYGRVRWLLRSRPLPDVVSALRSSGSIGSSKSEMDGFRLGQAVTRTLRAFPFDSRCLVTSLVLTAMLARRGIESRLVVGVDVDPTFSAHAWVESGGEALLQPLLDHSGRLVEL